jgi:hypothetical protein
MLVVAEVYAAVSSIAVPTHLLRPPAGLVFASHLLLQVVLKGVLLDISHRCRSYDLKKMKKEQIDIDHHHKRASATPEEWLRHHLYLRRVPSMVQCTHEEDTVEELKPD